MDKTIWFIQLTFENLDYVSIPMEYINAIELTNITTDINQYFKNSCHKIANSVLIRIDKSYVDIAKHLDSEYADMYLPLDKRLVKNDITSIDIYYENGEVENYYVAWEDCEDNEYSNQFQSTVIDKDNITVKIHNYGEVGK